MPLTEIELRDRWKTSSGKRIRSELIEMIRHDRNWCEPILDLPGSDEIEHNADLRGIDLKGTPIPGADLSYANLDFGCFEECDLGGANLYGASAKEASFLKANFTLANIVQLEASGSNFDEVDFYRTHAMCTDFGNCTFRKAHLCKVAMSSSNCIGVIFDGSDLSEAELFGSKFEGASFKSCDMNGIDLKLVDFRGATLE